QKAAAELTRSAANLLDGATVVRDSADSTHLVVTSSTAKAAAEAKRFAAAVSPELAGSLPEEPKATPDRPVVLDLWVNGGTFTAAEINLLQFIDGATGRVAVRVEASTGTPITAPAGATAIDLTSLAPKPRTA
ncbi:MAG TPA: hypothetical protein VFO77_11505, partial [Actinoplanes sp.]|nr:hypothetical protein [Actinoplanes sp.]